MLRDRGVLITNDFPPKVGGIQNYLWELWRRLPPDATAVYTTPYRGADAFDREQAFAIERSPEPVLIPYPWLAARLRSRLRAASAQLAIYDPALPLGAIGPAVGVPYALVLHGAEVAIPARLPALNALMRRTLNGASLIIAAGQYVLDEAERCADRPLVSVTVPPGVDVDRFRPLGAADRRRLRREMGVGETDVLVTAVSRLVPRKGMETLIRAVALVNDRRPVGGPNLRVKIGGDGRQSKRLRSLVSDSRAPVELLGRISDAEVVRLYQAADLTAMLCNERWFGLEQEGFGIVFLEAAACGVPQIAGRSGGSHEAVEHDRTGLIVDHPLSVPDAAAAIEALIANPDRRAAMGRAARERAATDFSYDVLARKLDVALVTAASTG